VARLIWTEPALADLEAVADYIALDNPAAASRPVRRVFESVAASSFSLSMHLLLAQRLALFLAFTCSHTKLLLVLDRRN